MPNEDFLTEEEDYKGHNIKIYFDEDAESPRDWDNICVIHTAHNNYSIGDEDHSTRESIEEARKEAEKSGGICLDLYLYDHSGITISLTPFSCHWDSGRVGFVHIPRQKMLEEFSKKRWTPQLKEKALEIAKAEVETLDYYVTNQAYGYVIEDKDGEEVDSCWGYIGDSGEVLDEAKSIVDNIVKEVVEV